jgi:predicted metal-dependent hydrolase
MDFKELTMQLHQEGQQYKFQGITISSPKMISSHRMENMLKKGHSGIISQLHAIQATKTPSVLQDLQYILYKHQVVFSPSHMVFMIIPYPLSQESFLPIFVPIITHFPKKMKLRNWFKNYLTRVLSTLV